MSCASRGRPRRFETRAAEVLSDRCGQKIDEELLDFLLRDLPFETELPIDGGGMVRMMFVERAGDSNVVHPVFVSDQIEQRARDRHRRWCSSRDPSRRCERPIHDRERERAVNVTAHHPGERPLLVESVRVVVAALHLLADEPVGEQCSIRLEPTSTGGVRHRSDRDVEVRDPVVALEMKVAGEIGDLLGDPRAEGAGDPGFGPSGGVPVAALGRACRRASTSRS